MQHSAVDQLRDSQTNSRTDEFYCDLVDDAIIAGAIDASRLSRRFSGRLLTTGFRAHYTNVTTPGQFDYSVSGDHDEQVRAAWSEIAKVTTANVFLIVYDRLGDTTAREITRAQAQTASCLWRQSAGASLRTSVSDEGSRARRERYLQASKLIRAWLKDESGYDAESWRLLEASLDRDPVRFLEADESS